MSDRTDKKWQGWERRHREDRRKGKDQRLEKRGIRNVLPFSLFLDRRSGQDRRSGTDRRKS